MKARICLFLCLIWPALLPAQPEAVRLTGTLTNTSSGDVSAPARLELTIDDGKVHARLTTEKPLTGTGELTGRLLGGWLELVGQLGDGLTVKFRGALSPTDYRGIYLAATEGQLVQYGRFELARADREAAPSPPPPVKR